MKRFGSRCSAGTVLTATGLFLFLAPLATPSEELSARRIQSLVFNQRVIREVFEFRGRENVDTGFSVEECLLLRLPAGNRIYLLKGGLARTFFLPQANYDLEIRFVGFSRQGIPIARAAGTSALVRQEDQPYEGDIRETDARVKEIKAALARGQTAPAELRLRYSGTRGDYLAFYDMDGEEIYYRYREDRFDREAEERIADLIAGQAYLVAGDFLGLLLKNKLVPPGNASFRTDIMDADSIPAYEYRSARPLRIDQILF